MKTRKIPMRTCVACRTTRPKRELIRVVRTPTGTVVVDRKGKVSGRGAYICSTVDCFDLAVRSKKLEHALDVVLDSEIVDQLRQMVAKENISG
ncbi:MAG: YlxR family protein [Sulfobacillus thermosulfidooxidans]|uniref:Nucleic acid-binding protein n=1 Tax=Sulfobacillus thermotolerans TaxID=338644 RepID=A0ABM6RQL2_9FIRM|nr:YlxR family protein [Sulfobacillus sp. hq2]AUW93703.1 nucleic acid-binding protein [Sulfobacillus thermotolerans]MCY0907207.1 YlxR family protein [Sulfobacillus thermotolerans]POB10949.1 nucleic acid-binding protein [Sulfobacillus sp. hq2]PSR37631.1 MAG: YlxR family protein [Sulfobacillus thermosulfidooxidans]